jgi:hypothetical protein
MMCNKVLYLYFLFLLVTTPLLAQRNLLQNEFNKAGAGSSIANIQSWRNREKNTILQNVADLPIATKEKLIQNADQALKQPWASISSTDYREYKLNGNRVNFEGLYFSRRAKLSMLCIGQLVKDDDEYLKEIQVGIRLILEEPTWALPAHYFTAKRTADPNLNDPIIDLFAAETAAYLSWIKLLLGTKLNAIDPSLIKRIDAELENRILKPYMQTNDYWWMGWNTKRKQNNWNIWINSNILKAAILADNDSTRRVAMIGKVIKSSDQFLNPYPADGGCDEGPAYWAAAGGCLGELVTMLGSISEGKLDWKSSELIKNIGTYIYKVHIDGARFVNFADAPAFTIPDPARVFNFGALFNDEELKSFAAYLAKLSGTEGQYLGTGSINSFANTIRSFKALNAMVPKAPMKDKYWLPTLQVLNLRNQSGSAKGLSLMAKGGNNDESHNHNDVGNFMIYANGDPVIIDLGKGTYTKETFSSNRYKLFYNQSAWHNCPTINGVDEQQGPAFKAENVRFAAGTIADKLTMNLNNAYPEGAAVKSWVRELTYHRNLKQIVLREQYELSKFLTPSSLQFMVCKKPTLVKEGLLQLESFSGLSKVFMQYDPTQFEVSLAPKTLDDESLKSVWGNTIYKIVLTIKSSKLKGVHQITFK